MKWDIWVQPNQIFSEDYPDGWSHADVERAANNRYGGKVTAVNPSASSSYTAPNRSNGQFPAAGGGLGALVWIGIGLAALAVFGGGDGGERPAPAPQAPVVERSYAPSVTADPAASRPSTYSDGPCVTANFEPC